MTDLTYSPGLPGPVVRPLTGGPFTEHGTGSMSGAGAVAGAGTPTEHGTGPMSGAGTLAGAVAILTASLAGTASVRGLTGTARAQ